MSSVEKDNVNTCFHIEGISGVGKPSTELSAVCSKGSDSPMILSPGDYVWAQSDVGAAAEDGLEGTEETVEYVTVPELQKVYLPMDENVTAKIQRFVFAQSVSERRSGDAVDKETESPLLNSNMVRSRINDGGYLSYRMFIEFVVQNYLLQ